MAFQGRVHFRVVQVRTVGVTILHRVSVCRVGPVCFALSIDTSNTSNSSASVSYLLYRDSISENPQLCQVKKQGRGRLDFSLFGTIAQKLGMIHSIPAMASPLPTRRMLGRGGGAMPWPRKNPGWGGLLYTTFCQAMDRRYWGSCISV